MKRGSHSSIMIVTQGLVEHCIHRTVMADEAPILIGIVTSFDVVNLL